MVALTERGKSRKNVVRQRQANVANGGKLSNICLSRFLGVPRPQARAAPVLQALGRLRSRGLCDLVRSVGVLTPAVSPTPSC